MSTFLRRSTVAVAAALLAGAACTVHKSETPTLTGPSELGLSVGVTAVPDNINQDGASQSAIVVSVHDASGQPKAGVALRAEIVAGGLQDPGQLSARTLATGPDGKASTVYTAPAPTVGAGSNTVLIAVTAIGTDFQTATPQSVAIRLSPSSVLPVAGPPLAQFVVAPAAPNAKSPVTFDASSSCGSTSASGACTTTARIVTYAWDFGDGGTASGAIASHAFALQQTYGVTLTVTNDRGVSVSTAKPVAVGAGLLPNANFSFSPANPGVGETIFFNGSASTAGAGHRIVSYQWTSGDGTIGTGVTPSYAFLREGSYTVTLIVVDEVGQQSVPVPAPSTSMKVVAVGTGTPAPTASFTSSPTSPAANVDTVVFDASASKTVQGQTIVDYAWNFGDDTPVVHTTVRTTSHLFTKALTYRVNLVVTDSAGRIGQVTNDVIVR
jgi:PKD repeat protein